MTCPLRCVLAAVAVVAVSPRGHADEQALALVHARLVDGTGLPPVGDATVIIRGDRLAAAGPSASVSIPEGARIIDLRGATLLPGLINAHVHAAYEEGRLRAWAQAGVTTVRDEAPFDPNGFVARRDALNADPRNATIVAATPIISVTGGYGWGARADSPEAMRAVVQGFVERGADVVKTSLEDDMQGKRWELPTREEVRALVEAAHARGKRVSVHVMHARFVDWAVEAGADDLAHGVVEPVSDAVLKGVAGRGVIWVPTLELLRCVDAKHQLAWTPVALENLARFRRLGGVVAMGTDTAGYSCDWDEGLPITELTAMQLSGMSAIDVLQAATRNAAQACGKEDELGTITAGKRADLLAVRGDPLRDLHALLQPLLVVHRGVVIRDERAATR
jgi:imidazolonepropionase-like amidohydrolase